MKPEGAWILFGTIAAALLLYVLVQVPGKSNVSILGPNILPHADQVQNCIFLSSSPENAGIGAERNLLVNWTEKDPKYNYERLVKIANGTYLYSRCWTEPLDAGNK